PRCNLLPLTPVPSTAIYQHSHTRDLHSFPTRRSSDLRTARCPELVLRDHTVDDAVLLRLVGAHEVVALGVLLHLLDVLPGVLGRSEEHTSELQSHLNLVCRLLLEKKNILTQYIAMFTH